MIGSKKVICVALAFCCLSGNVVAQNISMKMSNVTVKQAMDELKSKSGYSFVFSSNDLNTKKKISVDAENQNVNEIVRQIVNGQEVSYQISGKNIIIRSFNKTAAVQQQKKTIKGTVVDASGVPVIGANIVVKGTTNGTITDMDGNFSLEVPQGSTLVVSYIGYTDYSIKIGNQKSLAITLKEDSKSLDEVVVVGYGKQSKALVTGAVAKVNMKKMEGTGNTNVSQALRGRVAGVQFLDNGRPGQEGSIMIRGRNSLSASNSPLIVVDGIVFSGSLSDINPSDIQSMEVLKDASASAIYGSRASNGVILVTSKQGSDGKPKVNFDGSFSVQGWSKKLNLLTPERYIQKTLDWRKEDGLEADPNKLDDYLWDTEYVNYKNGTTINPWDVVSQDSYIQNYNLSVQGGVKNTKYFFSGAYTDEKGLIYNDNANRIAFRANVDTQITSWFNVGMTAMYSRRNKPGYSADMGQAYWLSPFSSMYLDNGELKRYPFDESMVSNPLWNAEKNKRENVSNNLFANLYAVVDFSGFTSVLEGLTYRINYSPNYRVNNNYSFVPIYHAQGIDQKGSASKNNSQVNSWVLENIVNYTRTFNDKHTFDLTLLYGSDRTHNENTTASASHLLSNANSWNNLGLGEIQTASSNATLKTGISSMVRLNYRYQDRYLLTFTMRRDGASVFGNNNKYGNFPSGAIAWIASNEEFLKKVDWLDMLKLRISYGQTGNQAISPYQSLDRSGTNKYVFGDGSATYIGIYPTAMPNSNLTWETSTSANIALDFSFLRRLDGTLEFYNSKTNDLLIRRSIPSMNGFSSVMTNLGEVNNKGVELTLNSTNIKTNDFEWNTTLSLTYNKNKIVSLYGNDLNKDGIEDDDLGNRWFIDKPIQVLYDYGIEGVYQVGDEIPKGYKPGMYKYEDLDKDGKITPKDRKILGNRESPFRWGLTNSLRYKDWELSLFINAMHNWVGTNGLNHSLQDAQPTRVNFVDQGWWTEENKSNTRPKLINGNPLYVQEVVSRSFVRLQDVTLSYNIPASVLSKISIERLKIYLSGRNLVTITNWMGFDPESGYNTQGGYPSPRTFSIGLSTTF